MSTIIWQAKSEILFESFTSGELSTRASGGAAYEFSAAQALAVSHDLSFDANAVCPSDMSLFGYARRLRRRKLHADIVIKQPFPVVLAPRHDVRAEIGVVHHFDLWAEKRSLKMAVFNALLRRRLREMDAVVTVSQYWRRYLENAGCADVRVIYNAFPVEDFDYTQDDVDRFLVEHGVPPEKPIVYIGNASAAKGVYEAFEQLSGGDYTLVMTGRTNGAPDLPVRFFNLSRREFHLLLKASSVAVTMSRMYEGWNRVAHEAMLLGTPVVGSGMGGMRELLTNGGQLIAENIDQLPRLVAQAIDDHAALAAAGRTYVRQFDTRYWQRSWDDLLQAVER